MNIVHLLIYACLYEYERIVKLLIENGSEVNNEDRNGRTLLIMYR